MFPVSRKDRKNLFSNLLPEYFFIIVRVQRTSAGNEAHAL
jgi:hypothetical protein